MKGRFLIIKIERRRTSIKTPSGFRFIDPNEFGAAAEIVARLGRSVHLLSDVETGVTLVKRFGTYLDDPPGGRKWSLADLNSELIREFWISDGKRLSKVKLAELVSLAQAEEVSLQPKDLVGLDLVAVGAQRFDPNQLGASAPLAASLAFYCDGLFPAASEHLAVSAIKRLCRHVSVDALSNLKDTDIEGAFGTTSWQIREKRMVMKMLEAAFEAGRTLADSTIVHLVNHRYLPVEGRRRRLLYCFAAGGFTRRIYPMKYGHASALVRTLAEVLEAALPKLEDYEVARSVEGIRALGDWLSTQQDSDDDLRTLSIDVVLAYERHCMDRGQTGYSNWLAIRTVLEEVALKGQLDDEQLAEMLTTSRRTIIPVPQTTPTEAFPEALMVAMAAQAVLDIEAAIQALRNDPDSLCAPSSGVMRASRVYYRAIIGCRVLLHYTTDLEPEFTHGVSLADLRPSASPMTADQLAGFESLSKNHPASSDFIQMVFSKPRAKGKRRSVIVDRGSQGWWAIRSALRLTSRFRRDDQSLFILPDGSRFPWTGGPRSNTSLRGWVEPFARVWTEKLGSVVESGQSIEAHLELPKWGSFRKAAISAQFLERGQDRQLLMNSLSLAGEHSPNVLVRNYLPGMPELLGKLGDDFRGYAAWLESGAGQPLVDLGAGVAEPPGAQPGIIGGCSDPYKPFGLADSARACVGGAFALCLSCDNAVFALEHLPQVLFLRDRVFADRAEPPDHEGEDASLRPLLRKAAADIVGRFTDEEVTEAEALVAAPTFREPPLEPGLLQSEDNSYLREL